MNPGRIIHQQLMQLRWHVLACWALTMTLPFMDAIIALIKHERYINLGTAMFPLMYTPLLAALIGCATIQADFDPQRYLFWRSKPAGVKGFMALKYLAGLGLALLFPASLMLYRWVSSPWHPYEFDDMSFGWMGGISAIAVMCYSLAFCCNVFVRKTARAWLIAMALGVVLILLVYMLPFYTVPFALFTIIALTTLIALALSLLAARHDWRINANLKGLLYTAAAACILLLLIFTRQVANIKVLDEREFTFSRFDTLSNVQGDIYLQNFYGQCPRPPGLNTAEMQGADSHLISIENNHIQMAPASVLTIRDADPVPSDYPPPAKEGYRVDVYPHFPYFTQKRKNNTYVYYLHTYFIKAEAENQSSNVYAPVNYNWTWEVYLRCYDKGKPEAGIVSEINLTDLINDPAEDKEQAPTRLMRSAGDKLIVSLRRNLFVIDASDAGQLSVVEQETEPIRFAREFFLERRGTFSIPMVPLTSIDAEDRIRYSIDRYLGFYSMIYNGDDFFNYSLIQKSNDGYAFLTIEGNRITRYDITGIRDDRVRCRFRDVRPFTLLEQMSSESWSFRDRFFVKDDRLYACSRRALMVFDLSADRGIRKLGHFFRGGYWLHDIEVLDNGDILLCMADVPGFGDNSTPSGHANGHLILLKDPG